MTPFGCLLVFACVGLFVATFPDNIAIAALLVSGACIGVGLARGVTSRI